MDVRQQRYTIQTRKKKRALHFVSVTKLLTLFHFDEINSKGGGGTEKSSMIDRKKCSFDH